MTPARPANVAASVRARLLNVAKAQGVDWINEVKVSTHVRPSRGARPLRLQVCRA